MKKLASVMATICLVTGIYIIGNIVIVAQDSADMTIDTDTQKTVIETLVKDLNENYVFPELAQQMSKDITNRFQNQEYKQITSALEFAKKLTDDMQAISKDKHLRVRFSERELPVRVTRTEPTAEEQTRFIESMKEANFGFEKIERLPGNIGYIELRGFFDHEMGAKTVQAAMNFLANTDALIFDLRRNGGGSPEMVALISSYLFGDQPVHLNSLYWRKGDVTNEFWTKPKEANVKFEGKDVYVLTSNRTFSAAEEFSYNLKNLKRAQIVGETTGGGAHPGGTFRLDKHFGAFISTGRAISPITKTNWEGTGVIPDVPVSKELAFETAYLNALKKSLAKETDERMIRNLKRLIKETEATLLKMKKQ
jgi:C-terminal processing protease CtpA/Prc